MRDPAILTRRASARARPSLARFEVALSLWPWSRQTPAGLSGRGRGEVGRALLAAELFHLPDQPAGVLALLKRATSKLTRQVNMHAMSGFCGLQKGEKLVVGEAAREHAADAPGAVGLLGGMLDAAGKDAGKAGVLGL